MPLLTAKDISKSYFATRALDNVDFTLERGEIHVLLGQNGAGKSTLIKIISGAIRPDAGTITVDGKDVEHLTPIKSKLLGIATIYQEFNLIPDLSVAENVFLGRLPTKERWPHPVDWRKMRKDARAFFEQVGIALDPDATVRTLSIAEQQLVEIAKALSVDAKVIVLDEPTATLTRREISALFTLLKKMKQRGLGIIYISHRLEEIEQIGDRVTVLRDGKLVGTWNAADVRINELINAMVGRAVDSTGNEDIRHQRKSDEVLLEVKNLSDGRKIKDVNLQLRRGEIVGLGGLVGAGRTELARALFGADKIVAGELRIHGSTVTSHSCRNSVELRIGFLPEDRKSEGLLLNFSVKNNISLPSLKHFNWFGFMRRAAENDAAQDYIGKLQIKTTGPNQEVRLLSGGNQQKVVLAKWLQTNADMLIFDEPTRGIDVAAKEEFYKIILECAMRGAAVLLISSEVPELIRMSDRIVVMREGRIAGELDRSEFDPERLLSLAFGQSSLQ